MGKRITPEDWHGMLMKGELVRATCEDRKTQTRRVIAFVDPGGAQLLREDPEAGIAVFGHAIPDDPVPIVKRCPYGKVGDRIWVRETWNVGDMGPVREDALVVYRANYRDDDPHVGPWRSAMLMPWWASRLALEITSLRVERVQDIAETDAEHEGVVLPTTWDRGKDPTYRHHFAALWDEINADRGYPWSSNPWVWVIGYRRLDGTPAEVSSLPLALRA